MMKKESKSEFTKLSMAKKSKVKKPKAERANPCKTTPNEPHQCAYMLTCWSAMIRGVVALKRYYEVYKDCTLKDIPIDAMQNIGDIMFIIKPIELSWPYFITHEDGTIYRWAESIYQEILMSKKINHE